MLKQLGGAVVVLLLGVGGGYLLASGGGDGQVGEPPVRADTTIVPSYVLGATQQDVFEDLVPEEATSDRRNQADTVRMTETRVVQSACGLTGPDSIAIDVKPLVLEGRWYLDTASAPREPGDSAHYSVTWLEGDTTGRVVRQDALVRHPAPPGPLHSIATDTSGLHVEYGEWETDESPGFLIQKLPTTAGCAAEALAWGGDQPGRTYLACETGALGQMAATAIVGWLR